MKLNIYYLWLFLIVISAFSINARGARSIETIISVLSPENASVKVTGKLSAAQNHWSLSDSYANANNLTMRISALKFFDKKGSEISFIKQSVGEFETQIATNSFSYQLKLEFPLNASQSAHVSWLTKNGGLLLLNDLLPNFGDQVVTGNIAFALENNWQIATSEKKTGETEFQTTDINKSVFLVGDFSEQNSALGKTQLNLAQTGEWSFSKSEMLELATAILTAHQTTLGVIPTDKIQILLIPLPQKFGGEQWEAETRGSTIILCSAQIPFKSRALSILHEQLRHELFHLWIPNNLNLSGDYAWFYEGFTLYQALKTGVKLKYIRFADFLDVLSRAFDAAQRKSNSKTLSLLEASRLRWSGDFSEFVYSKGMTTAFLYDLAVLEKSGGKKSLDDILKEIYRRYQKPNAREPANSAILGVLKNTPELGLIIENCVEKNTEIDWTQKLSVAGLQNVSKISLTRLAVVSRLSKSQKKVLARLSYQMFEN